MSEGLLVCLAAATELLRQSSAAAKNALNWRGHVHLDGWV